MSNSKNIFLYYNNIYMNRTEFLRKLLNENKNYLNLNNEICIYENKEIKTSGNNVSVENFKATLESSTELKNIHMKKINSFGFDFNIKEIESIPLIIDINYDSLDNGKEEYSVYCDINELFDYWSSIRKNGKKIKIYRLESVLGDGPYSLNLNLKIRDNQTNPENDFLISTIFNKYNNNKKDWFFGFSSMDELKSWFNKDDLNYLIKEKKLKISEYYIDENFVIKGENQLIYKKEYSKLKNKIKYKL